MCYWLFSRPMENTIAFLRQQFAKKPKIAEANVKVLKAGWNFCDITELFHTRYEIPAAALEPGLYRNITGNVSLALGLIAASRRSGLPLFLGAYPITPASDVLHELSKYKNYGVTTFQAEDEIAAMCAAIGASFGGALGVTTTSGPGIALKSEAMNLAVMTELPVLICDIQRGGPSTGLPTKTEQSDLLQVMFGRNGDSPMPVIAASSPKDCFDVALEAVRIATHYMVPVVLLSDGYIANGSEPWKLPQVEELPDLRVEFRTDPQGFLPYERNPETLARPWAIPGTPGLEHRIGGIEKENITGNVSYDAANHEKMVHLRAEKVERIARDIPPLEVHGEQSGKLLVIGWGSTAGAIHGAVNMAQKLGIKVSRAHLRYLNPFPANLGEVLSRFERVLLPEMNLGQLAMLLRARFLKDVQSLTKVQGQPFTRQEILDKIQEILEPKTHVN
jgi:2-oxoglutarate ferredoxin oxidoreductase subunit alpha